VKALPEFIYYYEQVIPKGLVMTVTGQGISSSSEQQSLVSEKQDVPGNAGIPASSAASKDAGDPTSGNAGIPAGPSASETVLSSTSGGQPGLFQFLLVTISSWQKTLKHHLSRFGKDIREHPYGSSFWLFLLLSCLYGIIHALGPGHGKTIVVSYFLSHPGKYLHGVLMGNLLTFVHVFSAVIVVLLLRLVLNAGGISFETVSKNLAKVSYSLLIFLGIFLLGKCVYELKRVILRTSEDTVPDRFELKPLLVTAFVTGLVPCPGAALIFIFTITQQILFTGLLAMICLAIGMGATTALFALFAILSRSTLFRLAGRRREFFLLSHTLLSLAGAVVIMSIGALLLLGQG
jgi:ABC-type nickel/cobalt efflux system permease component RcnA